MRIVCISDVHGKWKNLKIPECDILISTGDYSFKGEKHMIKDFHEWLNKQDAAHIISVQGNHELWVEKNFAEAKEIAIKACPAVHFIEEGLIEIEGLKIWCSAITPWFFDWAYNRHRGPAIKKHWDLIPDDVNVIACHGPPAGILDIVYFPDGVTPKERVGCHDLMDRINQLKNLKLVTFGHIHGSHGIQHFNGITFVNSSVCGETYTLDYEATVIDL